MSQRIGDIPGNAAIAYSQLDRELQQLIEQDQYCVGFASCKSDEFSYSHSDLGHGIWTYYLVQGLRGEDLAALLENRFLTGSSLQRFLLHAVQATLKNMFSDQRVQTPCMFGNLTQDFFIADFAQGTGTPLTGWPEMTTEEWSVYSSIWAKGMEGPFSQSDLNRLGEVIQSYHRRTQTDMTETQMGLGLWLSDTALRYNFELARCMLLAFDSRQPFFSQDLETLVKEIRQIGFRESKIEADLRHVISCAYQTP
jgi:hypothetical protein